eukprot:1011791-Pyramimonas_sp.AAC.3
MPSPEFTSAPERSFAAVSRGQAPSPPGHRSPGGLAHRASTGARLRGGCRTVLVEQTHGSGMRPRRRREVKCASACTRAEL